MVIGRRGRIYDRSGQVLVPCAPPNKPPLIFTRMQTPDSITSWCFCSSPFGGFCNLRSQVWLKREPFGQKDEAVTEF
ncbi:hypothetical protein MTP99_016052 [Tenebrio molitor]|nr:hypothetical protein MTP99_016052 [Tenebrio molitor]